MSDRTFAESARAAAVKQVLKLLREPPERNTDIITLCEAHGDCVFSAFTNGTLIDEEFAREMLRVKNFIPAISVEGFEAAAAAAPTPPWCAPCRYSSATNCPSASAAAIPTRNTT